MISNNCSISREVRLGSIFLVPMAWFRTSILFHSRSILTSGTLSYKQCGVDIAAGNDLIAHIKPTAKATNRPGIMGGIGGFGGLFDTKAAGYKDPLLVSGTDGVGTKLKVSFIGYFKVRIFIFCFRLLKRWGYITPLV